MIDLDALPRPQQYKLKLMRFMPPISTQGQNRIYQNVIKHIEGRQVIFLKNVLQLSRMKKQKLLKKIALQTFEQQQDDRTVPRVPVHTAEDDFRKPKMKSRDQIVQDLFAIELMRNKRDAPVDLMGAHKAYDPDTPPQVRKFQILTSILLSVQTNDKVTYQTMQGLLREGLSLDSVLTWDEKQIKQKIKSVNFSNRKAVTLKRVATILKDKHGGCVPQTYEHLVSLPGVGPKIAYVFLSAALDKHTGVGVDTHVHRISNRLGWVNTKDAVQTELDLQKAVPQEWWGRTNIMLVGFGQQVCKASNPSCKDCQLNHRCNFNFSW